MPSAIVRFRPTGPWRFGPDSGTRDRVDLIFHSDSLYAAVTNAMLRLDFLEEWLQATAAHKDGRPEVCFSSLFPFQRDHLFVTPPRSLWPPPPSTKIRYKSARFVPLSIIKALVAEKTIDENRWMIDAESQCMIPSGEGPFRIALRSAAAIDRLDHAASRPHTTACLEFRRDAGLWCMVVFSNDAARHTWHPRVKSAFRLLADSGCGGERSQGWGRSLDPEWQSAPELWPAPEAEKGYWLLSVYAPAESDNVDWKNGNYETITRTGRIESTSNYGGLKAPSLMITEGSVIVAPSAPHGAAPNVAPSDFAHPVYRAGFAVTIPIPWKVRAATPPRPEPAKHAEPPTAQTPSIPEPSTPEPSTPEPATPEPEPEPMQPHLPTTGPSAPAPETEPVEPHQPTPQPTPEQPQPSEPKPDEKPDVEEPKFPKPPVGPTPIPQPVEPEPEPKKPEPESEPVEPHRPTPQPQPERPAPEPETPQPATPQPNPQPSAPEPSPKPTEPHLPQEEPRPQPAGPQAPVPEPTPQPTEPTPPAPEPNPKPAEPTPPKPEPEPEPIEPKRPEHAPTPDPIEPQTPQPETNPDPIGPDLPGLPGLEPAIASSNESVEAISNGPRESEP